jgi:molybdate transport system ATP-binding protein
MAVEVMPKPSARVAQPSPVCAVRIHKRLGPSETDFTLDVAFEAHAGITILFGPSGAGKTTVLDCIAGLKLPDHGRISADTRVFFDHIQGINLAVQERKIGYVLQDLALFPHLTAEANIAYGLAHLNRTACRERVAAILRSFRIAHASKQKPGNLSGGEQQRVALARALVTDPCLLLLDEPLAALDGVTKAKIIDDLRAWNAAHHVPILYVTHSRDEVFALGERVLVLENGRIVAQGTPHEVFTAPRQESVAQLAGFENIFDAEVLASNEDRGTMTCRLTGSNVALETPLVRAEVGLALRVGIRAGDILLATIQPQGLSARNIIPGRIVSLDQRDVIVTTRVDCGVEMNVHMTLAARDALELREGRDVWLIVKTHACHLMKN